MESNAVFIDEHGNRVSPEAIGTTHDIVGEQDPKTGAVTPTTGTLPLPVGNIQQSLMQEERVKNFISQTSPSQTLQSINYILQGYVYDQSKEEWVKVSDGIPDQIRLDFLQFITPDLSEDVRMTNLNADQINGIMAFVIEWVTDYLDIVADEQGLEEEQMTKIALIMIKSVYYTILRAQNGMERGQIFRSLKMGDNLSPQMPMQKQESWWRFWK